MARGAGPGEAARRTQEPVGHWCWNHLTSNLRVRASLSGMSARALGIDPTSELDAGGRLAIRIRFSGELRFPEDEAHFPSRSASSCQADLGPRLLS